MSIKKIQCGADERELLAEANFEYIHELPKPLKPLAVYYEYTRMTVILKWLILSMRDGYADRPPMICNPFCRRGFPSEVSHFLIKCDEFPVKPFLNARQSPVIRQFKGISLGGFLWPLALSLNEFLEKFAKDGFIDQQGIENWTESGHSVLVLQVQYEHCTNAEVNDIIGELIPKLRPPEFPQPPRAGRGGRSFSCGAVDMLNQLAAFKLEKSGVDFNRAKNLGSYASGVYGSRKGWTKAVRAAGDRIDQLEVTGFLL